jgi:isopenicillin N synthase-like dioxygenase
MDNRVPELSLAHYTHGPADAREAFSRELMRGLQRYGFIILRDHPVSTALLDKAYELSTAFFSQAEDTKLRYVGGPRGYAPFRTEHARNRATSDLKEFWQIGPERHDGVNRGEIEPPNIWPAAPPEFKATFLALYAALQETGGIILEALTAGLNLPSGFFATAALSADSSRRRSRQLARRAP